jgi:protein-tyrosine-phosphatase
VAVLLVWTGHSARSPVAEALLRHHTAGRVTVASAGTRPKPRVDPAAARALRDAFGIDIAGRRPRSLDVMARRRFDHVITLCDKAREACPELPGDPRRLHWSIPDPAAAGDADHAAHAAYDRTVTSIDTRVRYLLPTLTPTRQARRIEP